MAHMGHRVADWAVILLLAARSGDSAGTGEQGTGSDPTVVFDGDTCTYEGPNEITADGLTPVVLENE